MLDYAVAADTCFVPLRALLVTSRHYFCQPPLDDYVSRHAAPAATYYCRATLHHATLMPLRYACAA